MGKVDEVVNFSDEEEEDCPECPLCMEVLEIDDQTFYPCGCGYQICRFCWHRIRTNDNGLCPACRCEYKEDPVNFKPLTCEDIVRIKNEKKQRSLEKKQKMAESRKHLSDIRVLQRNLVFVTGIPPKLADVEILKKPEYFGRYGKIHKCVLNQQGPVATAYATYVRDEDAFKAVLGINGTYLQNNILRASLGTTKYCSYFLRHLPCPKQDCMYLHGLGDGAASFTKADMQAGKHQQYENIIFREYFSKKAETMKQNASRLKMSTKDDLTCQPGSRDAWCPQPPELLDNRNIRSISESEHGFYNKASISDPDLSSATGNREVIALEPPASCDWNEVNSQRRNSLSSPSEDELDFDPWEISKDGLEELIQNQNQAESEISSSSDVPSTTTTLSQPSTTCPPPNFNSHFQVQNNFINHIQPKPEPFMFQSFQQTQQAQPFSPFNLTGMQHPGPGSLERNFGGLPQSHLQPGAPGLTAPGFGPHKKPFAEGFYNSGFEGANYGDIRLHDPSIVSTSPGQQERQRHSPPGGSMDMSSLQQGLQELFPHANISFSDPFGTGEGGLYGPFAGEGGLYGPRSANELCQRVRQAPPGFQNVAPSYTNQLLCQQLQNEQKVIKIQ